MIYLDFVLTSYYLSCIWILLWYNFLWFYICFKVGLWRFISSGFWYNFLSFMDIWILLSYNFAICFKVGLWQFISSGSATLTLTLRKIVFQSEFSLCKSQLTSCHIFDFEENCLPKWVCILQEPFDVMQYLHFAISSTSRKMVFQSESSLWRGKFFSSKVNSVFAMNATELLDVRLLSRRLY